MEFLSITLEGFLSYYKEVTLDFSEGTTVILGLNNSGKSKLFDAINWVMYERVFDSDRREWVENPIKIEKLILSNRAKKEAIQNSSKASAKVSLQIHSDEYPDKIVTIERKYEYDYSSSQTNPKCSKTMLFSVQDEIDGNTVSYDGDDAKQRINSLCSPKIRDFVLFKGEIADDLLQLAEKNQTAIVEAVREVSRLELFEKATAIANQYADSKYRVLTKFTSVNKAQEDRKKQIEQSIVNKERTIEDEKKQKDEYDRQIEKYSLSVLKLKNELSAQEDFVKLFSEKEKLENDRQRLSIQLKNYHEINRSISDTWVFYKIRDKINSFADFYSKLELKGHVPAPISQSIIKKSLDDHCCALCGQELIEGNKYHSEVKKKVQNEFIDGLGKSLGDMNYAFGSKVYDIENVPNAIKNYVNEKNKQEESKKFIQDQLDTVLSKIKNAQISASDTQRKQHLEQVKHAYNEDERELSKAKYNSSLTQGHIDVLQKELDQLKRELLGIVSSEASFDVLDKAKLYYGKKLSEAMTKLCIAAQDLAYSEIENTANEYYHEMVKNNPAIVGDIRIDKANSEIYSRNASGDKITNINEGNRVAIQLAVAAGILTVAGRQFNSYYPFVTDAPTSNMDAANKRTTINCMIQAFEQSIIIVKDDSDKEQGTEDPLYSMIKSSNDIDKAYRLELFCEPGGTIEDQYTVIKELK